MARRLSETYGGTPAEALWRDGWGSAMARRLLKRFGGTPAEAL